MLRLALATIAEVGGAFSYGASGMSDISVAGIGHAFGDVELRRIWVPVALFLSRQLARSRRRLLWIGSRICGCVSSGASGRPFEVLPIKGRAN